MLCSMSKILEFQVSSIICLLTAIVTIISRGSWLAERVFGYCMGYQLMHDSLLIIAL